MKSSFSREIINNIVGMFSPRTGGVMPTKLKKVNWFKNPKSLSEIYQQTGMLFSFVTAPKDGVSEMCHEWVKCRDFLHDAVRTQLTGNPSSIYGFTFNANVNPPIDTKKMRMLVSVAKSKDKAEGKTFMRKMSSALSILNHFERHAPVALSKVEEVDPKGAKKAAVVMFTGSSMWMKSPFLVSMYTFLIRLGDKELKFKDKKSLQAAFKELNDLQKERKINDNDAKYIGASWNKLHRVIKKRAELFPKKDGFHDIYFSDHGISIFHDRSGIYSLSTFATPDGKLNEKAKEILK